MCSLGQSLGSQQPLALHSFGWNLGSRAEEKSPDLPSLTTLVSRPDLDLYSGTFFTLLAPIFDVVDQESFSARSLALYDRRHRDSATASIIAGVVALGSLFHLKPHSRELEIVQFAKNTLEDAKCTRRPSADHVVGWILRTIYLRATTRPNNAWLASSTTMHLVEATGLHIDPATVHRTSEHLLAPIGGSDRLRRIFWCAWALNKTISYEYSRTAVLIPNVTCHPVEPIVGNFLPDWIQLVQTIPDRSSPESLMDSLHQLAGIASGHPMLRLTKADVSFCFFRRLRQLGVNIPTNAVDVLLGIGDEATGAADELIGQKQSWWNILGAIFQYTCVLLALDTQSSLARLHRALSTLEAIAGAFDTHLAKEALVTARVLVKAAMAKKREELAFLEEAVGNHNEIPGNAQPNPRNDTATPQELTDLGLNWDLFLNDPFPFTFSDTELGA
ncbi:hypothetical protein SLS55_008400 [Diplodia seriata]|uniref:Xylanolytic transcriptional activator regulatory domain-containing protein n=1 Tax=Diplodia seriata TaxID=420778 RepID=A0ABR3CCV9_9PEZI